LDGAAVSTAGSNPPVEEPAAGSKPLAERKPTAESKSSDTDTDTLFLKALGDKVHLIKRIDFSCLLEKAQQYHPTAPKELIGDLQRFLLLKILFEDWDADKLSPSPLIDVLWHHAILNTSFYANLMETLGVQIHHRADDMDPDRMARLQLMLNAFHGLFGHYPIGCTPIQLFVRVGDIRLNLSVLAEDTVESVKRQLFVIQGTPVELQRLTYANQELQNDRTLADHYVRSKSVLEMTATEGLMSYFILFYSRI